MAQTADGNTLEPEHAGDAVGSEVVGDIDGDNVGDIDGDTVGTPVVGALVGDTVGSEVVGEVVGSEVVGDPVGEIVGGGCGGRRRRAGHGTACPRARTLVARRRAAAKAVGQNKRADIIGLDVAVGAHRGGRRAN